MKPLACRYSIIQFVPYVETGEFANIGIVLVCPQTGYFGFLLQERRTKRITDFFEGLERGHFRRAVDAVKVELGRVRTSILTRRDKNDGDFVRGVFNALTMPREAIVRFSETRVLMTVDPAAALQEKFDHYVDHSFATPEYVEQTMNGRLKDLLARLSLIAPFRPARIGNEVVNAKFDFVQTLDGEPLKVIKALNLTHKDANDMAAHGDVWLGKLKRLRKFDLAPPEILFNVELAEQNAGGRFDLGFDIVKELKNNGVDVVTGHDKVALDQIKEFAEA